MAYARAARVLTIHRQHKFHQFDTCQRFIISLVTAAVSDERRCSAHRFLGEVPAHPPAPSSAALAEGSRADCIQTISPRVGYYTGPHQHTLLTSFVRWQMSRLVSDSVPVHLHHWFIWLSAAPDSYCRWPTFPGRRCTCLEQSARSCHFRTFWSSLPVPP